MSAYTCAYAPIKTSLNLSLINLKTVEHKVTYKEIFKCFSML